MSRSSSNHLTLRKVASHELEQQTETGFWWVQQAARECRGQAGIYDGGTARKKTRKWLVWFPDKKAQRPTPGLVTCVPMSLPHIQSNSLPPRDAIRYVVEVKLFVGRAFAKLGKCRSYCGPSEIDRRIGRKQRNIRNLCCQGNQQESFSRNQPCPMTWCTVHLKLQKQMTKRTWTQMRQWSCLSIQGKNGAWRTDRCSDPIFPIKLCNRNELQAERRQNCQLWRQANLRK